MPRCATGPLARFNWRANTRARALGARRRRTATATYGTRQGRASYGAIDAHDYGYQKRAAPPLSGHRSDGTDDGDDSRGGAPLELTKSTIQKQEREGKRSRRCALLTTNSMEWSGRSDGATPATNWTARSELTSCRKSRNPARLRLPWRRPSTRRKRRTRRSFWSQAIRQWRPESTASDGGARARVSAIGRFSRERERRGGSEAQREERCRGGLLSLLAARQRGGGRGTRGSELARESRSVATGEVDDDLSIFRKTPWNFYFRFN